MVIYKKVLSGLGRGESVGVDKEKRKRKEKISAFSDDFLRGKKSC